MRRKSLSNTSHGLQRLFSKPAKGKDVIKQLLKELVITLAFWLLHPLSFSPFLLGLTSDSWILRAKGVKGIVSSRTRAWPKKVENFLILEVAYLYYTGVFSKSIWSCFHISY